MLPECVTESFAWANFGGRFGDRSLISEMNIYINIKLITRATMFLDGLSMNTPVEVCREIR